MVRNQPKTFLGAALKLTFLAILYAILADLVIVLIASYTPLPIGWVYLLLILILGVGGYFLFKRNMPKVETLKPNKPEDWLRVGALVAVAFTVGQTLITLSQFYSKPVTQSTCIDPVNATISNCRTFQTTSLPQSNFFGNYGALTLQIAVIFVLVVVVLFGLFSFMSKQKQTTT